MKIRALSLYKLAQNRTFFPGDAPPRTSLESSLSLVVSAKLATLSRCYNLISTYGDLKVRIRLFSKKMKIVDMAIYGRSVTCRYV